MRPLAPSILLALAAALPATALAGPSLVDVLGDADEVTITGTVDLPLYQGPQGQSVPTTFITIGEHRFLVAVDPGAHGLFLNEGAAGKLQAKVKTAEVNGSERSYFEVDEVDLGGVLLSGVRFGTSHDGASSLTEARAKELREGVRIEGLIGLGALTDDLAWAILPEEGVIRLAPATDGGALVAALGGTVIETRVGPADKIKFGKDKLWRYPDPLIGPALFGETTVESALTWGMYSSVLDSSIPLPANAPEASKGDVHIFHTLAGLSAGDLETTWTRQIDFWGPMTTAEGLEPTYKGAIGLDVLEHLSVAYDPATGQLSSKPAAKQVRKDPLPDLLVDAQTALDESIAKAAEAAAEGGGDESADGSADGSAKPDGDAGTWKRIAEVKEDMGDFVGAIEALENVAAFDDTACDAWYAVGERKMANNDLAGAEAALKTASTLYHAWWDDSIPLHDKWADLSPREIALADRAHLAALTRAKYTEMHAKAKKRDIEPVDMGLPEGVVPQPGAQCMRVDAALAAVKLAKGEVDAIPALYAARAEYDKALPVIEGNRALAMGQPKAAASAFRQAMRMNLNQDQTSRLGLAVAQAQAGNWDQAKATFALSTQWSASSEDARAWIDAWAARDGAVKAAKGAHKLSDSHPRTVSFALEWARQANAAGDTAARDKALARATAEIAERLAFDSDDADALALQAHAKLIGGDLVGARKAAERSVKRLPDVSNGWRALAEINAAEGKTAEAEAALRRSVATNPWSPVNALVIGTLIDGTGDAAE
jgi:hypothetical protein